MFSRGRNSQFYWSYYLPYLTISPPTNYWQEIRKRGLKVSVAGVPKTIDNDIAVIFCKICLLSMQKPSLHTLLIWPLICECDTQISWFLDHRQVFWFWYSCGRSSACYQFCLYRGRLRFSMLVHVKMIVKWSWILHTVCACFTWFLMCL